MYSRSRVLLSILKLKELQLHKAQMLLSSLPLRTLGRGINLLEERLQSHKFHSGCSKNVAPLVNVVEEETSLRTAQNQKEESKCKVILSVPNYKHSYSLDNRKGLKTNTSWFQSCIRTKPIHHNAFIFINLKLRSIVLKQNLMLRGCQKRCYSKNIDSIDKSEDKENEEKQSDQEIKNTQEMDDSLKNDPWLKSVLFDIRQDFDSQSQQKSASYDDDTDKKSETEDKKDGDYVNKSNTSFDADRDYEYDYRYAGDDDIEEFGYFDDKIIQDAKPKRDLPISLNRGENGVFELEELVNLMEHLGGDNIVTVPIPPEANYCDHMVIVTARSRRHLQALNEEMLWVHKRKKSKKDPTLHIEGKDKSEWCAMDIGNLVLHIFLNEERRQYYDIESLWLLGPDNDPKCQQEEDQHSFALSAEDLYWMEVRGTSESKTEDKINSSKDSQTQS